MPSQCQQVPEGEGAFGIWHFGVLAFWHLPGHWAAKVGTKQQTGANCSKWHILQLGMATKQEFRGRTFPNRSLGTRRKLQNANCKMQIANCKLQICNLQWFSAMLPPVHPPGPSQGLLFPEDFSGPIHFGHLLG